MVVYPPGLMLKWQDEMAEKFGLSFTIVDSVQPLLVVTIVKQLSYRRQNPTDPLLWTVSRIACTAVATVPGTLAGLSLVVHWGGGLY